MPSISDEFNLGERKDELAPIGEELLLARDNAVLEMPGQDQEIIGLHRACLWLGNDRNVRPRRERAELVFIDLGDGFDEVRADAAKLQDHIALGRGTIAENALAVVFEGAKQPREILPMPENALLKVAEGRRRSEAHTLLLLQQPIDHRGIARP